MLASFLLSWDLDVMIIYRKTGKRTKMFKINKMLNSAVLGGLLALSATTFNTEAGVLIKDWNGSGDSGFGDIAMPKNDDNSTAFISFDNFEQLNFNSGLNFFSQTQNYNGIFINNNGNITFNSALNEFTPETFPISEQPMIAPFWGDVDTSCIDCGDVYIGSPNANTIVVTWNEVSYFGSEANDNGNGGDFEGGEGDFEGVEPERTARVQADALETSIPKTNTFQLVLIDRADTGAGNFDVEFRYEDINWTTGDASNGTDGLGGSPAQAGFDAGNNHNFFVVPGSQQAAVVDLDTALSNTDTAGIWTFGIRDGVFDGSTPERPIMPIIDPNNPGDYPFEFVIIDDDPIFIDPDVAIGYDYIVNSGPNFASVILPDSIGNGVYDLWLWDNGLADWYDTGTDISGGLTNQHTFDTVTDRFRIMGIEIDEMLDPTDSSAFVTGLTFDGTGLINMEQNAVTVFVADPTSVPEPQTLLLFIAAFGFMVRTRFRVKK